MRRARTLIGAGVDRVARRTDEQGALDHYVDGAPSPQRIVDLFAGEWSTRFPEESGVVSDPGPSELFGDGRLLWALDRLGGVAGRSVVELGPLEGAHTVMLERAGATRIDAVEANSRAFLRCLCTKEVFGLEVARFHLGDAGAYLEQLDASTRYDVGIASGVLYHVEDPVGLLAALGSTCDALYLWTHYFDEDRIASSTAIGHRFSATRRDRVGDFEYEYGDQEYRSLLRWSGFCGGAARGSRWLTRDSLDAAIRRAGYTELDYHFVEPDNPHGPSLAVCATR